MADTFSAINVSISLLAHEVTVPTNRLLLTGRSLPLVSKCLGATLQGCEFAPDIVQTTNNKPFTSGIRPPYNVLLHKTRQFPLESICQRVARIPFGFSHLWNKENLETNHRY
jgi:hypothetical protein